MSELLFLMAFLMIVFFTGLFYLWRMEHYYFDARYGISVLNGLYVPWWFLVAAVILTVAAVWLAIKMQP